MFNILLDAGVIVPMHETNDERELYTVNPKDGYVIDHA